MQEIALELDSDHAIWTAAYNEQHPGTGLVPPFSAGDGGMASISKNMQAAPAFAAATFEVRQPATRV